MINLKIDPEFQNQIPPLTDDEYKQLEENILKEGKLLSPLLTVTIVMPFSRSTRRFTSPLCHFHLKAEKKSSHGSARISWGDAISPRSRSCSSSGSNMKRKNPLMAKPAKNRMMKMADFTGVLKLITPVKP